MPHDDHATSTPSAKQAVLLIHGMGEQVPLGTLREFVETVYQRDPRLRSEGTPVGALNRVWMVPDDATGTAELRRLTTPPVGEEMRRTDFFELYWADVTEGAPIEAVLGWVRGLVLRPWSAVPNSPKVRIAWLFLIAVTAFFAIFTISTLDPTGTLFNWLIAPTKTVLVAIHHPLGLLIALAGMALWAREHDKEPARMKVTLPLLLFVGGLVLAFLPPPLLDNDKVWSGLLALTLAAILNGVVAPYVGDVVRYVRANPSTVERRRIVRERGVKLLEELHKKKNRRGEPLYDRIIIVAHSLGSIVGYDLIQLYWEKYGPTHRFKRVDSAVEAYAAVDEFVKQWWVRNERTSFDLRTYQQAQSDVFEAIRHELPFRISDFVTVGSPLAHAQFLLRDDKAALEAEFEERLFSSSPPRPDRPRSTMTYDTHGQKDGPYLHFAAPFAAVRWTNIYDECWFPFGGDVVSGSLTETFGPGIKEHPVRIVRPGVWPPLNRLVTHTLYWAWHDSFVDEHDEDDTAPVTTVPTRKLPEHIQFLRDAIFLKADMEQRLSPAGKRAATSRNAARERPPGDSTV